MGKRLLRYYPPELFLQLQEHKNRTVSLVMKDDRVHDGTLLEVSETLILKDKLGRRHILKVSDVLELLVDFESAY